MSDDTVPGQLDEVQRQLGAGERRMQSIEDRMSNLEGRLAENTALTRENTRITQESADDIKAVRDYLAFGRVGSKIIKWLGGLGAVIATGITLWQLWRKP
jgi:uncharacterized membrane-anchored protein